MSNWRSIETAPLDGQRVLLFYPAGTAFAMPQWVVGQFDKDQHAKNPKPYWANDCIRWWGVTLCRKAQPTHWTPLGQP